ncbi:hypothetical protein [Streptomyces virginiae]|uniref:hypothetical protein n=1 Tax=Streptomyces virginiae TaxID=1961 RepID=UPI0036475A52
MEAKSITSWRSSALEHLTAARARGDQRLAEQIINDLITVHTALGERRTGTRAEQNAYLMARGTRTPVPELLNVGIDTNAWPTPPASPAVAEPRSASPATERRITDLFQSAGPLADRSAAGARYEARYRPQDGQVFRGEPLPWAIWDTHENMPVSYHSDKELSEYQAATASDRYARLRQPE